MYLTVFGNLTFRLKKLDELYLSRVILSYMPYRSELSSWQANYRMNLGPFALYFS